jgi:cytochrome c oxidase subunit II
MRGSPLLVGALLMLSASAVGQTPGVGVRRVTIVAERYDFFPSEIKVPIGTVLEIDLESEDTLHGFRILGSNLNVAIPKRGNGRVQVTFRAERAGEFTFECSRMCGAGHNFMRGRILVHEDPR